MGRPAFLAVFERMVGAGEWVDSQTLARRMHPDLTGPDLSERSKEVSRLMSNLERFGHLDRRLRPTGMYFEYRIAAATRQPARCVFDLAELAPTA